MSNHYFVTGATGAVGSALIPLLLEDRHAKIWILLRAESNDHLQQRLQTLLDFWEVDKEQAEDAKRRITPIQGDTDAAKFAMQSEQYAEIAQQCTHIIHCAGVVRMNLPLEVARQHALGSAKNIIELALACQAAGNLQKVEFVSTVGVAGRMPGNVPETWITLPRTFHNTYEQSKAEAEDYLREQIEQHSLPVTVHRPSMVVGDSKTGKIIHFQIFYHICEFLAGRRSLGLLPFLGNTILDTVPVDYVAGVICWSSGQQMTIGKILHECSGPKQAITLKALQIQVRQMMRAQDIKIPMLIQLPTVVFNFAINWIAPFLSEKMQRAIKAFPFFLDYLADEQGFSNQETIQLLEQQANMRLPEVSSYLAGVLTKYLQGQVAAH